MKTANLALAFALEIAALIAIATWGRWYGTSTISGWLWAAAAIGAWALLWGTFFSPKAAITLTAAWSVFGQCAMLALGPVALAATGRWQLAAAFTGILVLNRVVRSEMCRRPGCGRRWVSSPC